MWRRISTVGVLLCGAHKIPAVMLHRGHLSSLKTPSFSLSLWSKCWEPQLGKRAANRSSNSLWPSWSLEVTANELEKKKPQINNFRASGLILEGQGWSQTLLTGCLSITQGDGPGLTCRSRPRTGPALASGGKMEDYWDHRKIPSLCTSCPSDADICSVAAFQHKF